jgi:hypothetical protein
MKKLLLPLTLFTVIGGMIGLFMLANNTPATPDVALLGDKHADLGQKHIKDGEQHAAYNSELPSSGPHYASATPWGIKDGEIVDETLIHSMEHGGIVIAYKPDLPPAQISQLKDIFAKLPASSRFNEVKAVLVPRAANDRPIELAAWTYTYNLDEPDAAKILGFYGSHLDKGPELVP